jgi:hypothetical protein
VFLLVSLKLTAQRIADVSSLSQKTSDPMVLLFCALAAYGNQIVDRDRVALV